jgi:diketogulonate reductase-like aldo/keto reductase
VRGKPLPEWAAELGCHSWAQFFLRYIVSHPAVTCVIPATGNPAHALDCCEAGREPLPDQAARQRMARYFEQL